ncbi:MAG: ABC transporter permease [Candidatus Nealsonbacteria bacterium]|nr:ABC transporter permease [Candidatus Nealsonbacteria bacterium]
MSEINEYFKIALRNLKTRSLRSWLTILGIVIGIFLVISLLSLSEGIKKAINQQLETMGGDMIMVMPGSEENLMGMMMGGEVLEREDIMAIEKTKGVENVLIMSYRGIVVRYKEEAKMVFLTGLPWDQGLEILEKFQGWSLSEGRWPVPGKREVIVGKQWIIDIFKEKVRVDEEIVMKGRKFKVIGILNSLGNKSDDSNIYLDIGLYQDLTGEKRGSARVAMVKIEEGLSADKVAQDLKESLQKTRKRRFGEDTADFAVVTSEKIMGITNNVLGIIQSAIIFFASIAILVGGIGITNTMFTSIRERTREIGVMKAIGAKNSTVLTIFLIEAGIIGLVGGAGGIILGIICAKIIELYSQANPLFYFSVSVSPGLILFGLTFSLFVGCFAGFLPARQAARLKPVEALRRYE